MVLNLTNDNKDYVISEVVKMINDGEVVISPTDTVYGMLADAFNVHAINMIYSIKEREKNKPLLILIKDVGYSEYFTDMEIPKCVLDNIPGELTFIMPLKKSLRKNMSYLFETVALRIPNNDFITEILKGTPPIVAPSANPSGAGVIYDGNKLVEIYKDKVGLIVNAGVLSKKEPSTLYDCINKKVLRQGKVFIK